MPESSARTTISLSPSTFVAGFLSCPYILLKGLEHVLHDTNIEWDKGFLILWIEMLIL